MNCYTYLKDEAHYSDLYDRQTVEECRTLERRFTEASAGTPADQHWQTPLVKVALYFLRGERHARKADTIMLWRENDRQRDRQLAQARPPRGIRCVTCFSDMVCEEEDLGERDGGDHVLFFFSCPKCDSQRAFYEDGTEYRRKKILCSQCQSEANVEYQRAGGEVSIITTCPECGKIEAELLATGKSVTPDEHYAADRLSVEAQRGLWGELHVLRTHLLPALGAAATVAGWKASAAAHQDFQFSGGAAEVKTTAAKQPQSVRITSERQLDDTGVGALFLHVVVVDEREVPAGGSAPGQSLPALIADTRTELSADPVALTAFNDRLLDRGWLDAHASRYEGRRWTVRGERTYQVRRGFPRLVEVDLPTGVGDVNFAVSLAACEPFAAPVSGMLKAVAGDGKKRRRRL